MDIASITDIKELKALAYDQLLLQQQTESNLRLLQQRIHQLMTEQALVESNQRAKKSEA